MSVELLGSWRTDPSDIDALSEFGDVRLTFLAEGLLEYVILGQDKDEVILLRYRTENPYLITNQPSSPREEKNQFAVREGSILEIKYDGRVVRYLFETQQVGPTHIA